MIKRRIIILIALIAALLAVYVGITYAAFTSNTVQTNENVISTTDCLSVDITGVNSPLSLTNSYPMRDEVAQNKTPYTFTLTNECENYVVIDIGFEIDTTNSTLTSGQVKATISRTGVLGTPALLNTYSAGVALNEGEAYVLYSDDLRPGESKTYDYRMWLNYTETSSSAANKGISGTIVVTATIKTDFTLRGAILNNRQNFLTGADQSIYTTPGRENATDSELLRTAPDDYGTSYYFRGTFNNNYVLFANMCWRIVRIDGLGNIKLVLYNYNPNGVSNPCATSEDGATNAYARVNNVYRSQFNTDSDNNAYLGYMYSNNVSSNDFNTAHSNDNDSAVLTFLKTWYDNVFTTDQKDKLADVIWCNDKKLITDSSYDPMEFGNVNPTGTGQHINYYNGSYRLNPASTAQPSLICPNVGSDGKLSKFTASDTANGNGKLRGVDGVGASEYKIGLLTADEIAFAGAMYQDWNNEIVGNSVYYLSNNANESWWTLTPLYYEDMIYVMIADKYQNGSFISIGSGVDDSYVAVRPAISLKATTTIVEDTMGFKDHPYVIN